MKTITYTVTGRWPFPLDMLRYDGAVAASPSDQAKIELLSTEHMTDEAHAAGIVTIDLVTERGEYHLMLSADRWTSFGWGSSKSHAAQAKAAEEAVTVEELEMRLEQIDSDIAALNATRTEIIQRIAAKLPSFKVGDVLIGDKGLPFKVTHARAFQNSSGKVAWAYYGMRVLKDGTLGAQRKALDNYQIGYNVRLANPDTEVPLPKGKLKAGA